MIWPMLGEGVGRATGADMVHHFVRRAGVVTPSAEETVNLRCHALAAGGLSLADTLAQTARKGEALALRQALGLAPKAVNCYSHNRKCLKIGCKGTAILSCTQIYPHGNAVNFRLFLSKHVFIDENQKNPQNLLNRSAGTCW
jgi:hypothetical protein